MTTPTYCTSCGHELGIGRFCTNCGKPVPGRHPEAPPVAPVVPPPVSAMPPAARYPLYADTALGEPPSTIPQVGPPEPAPPPPPPPTPSYDDGGRRRMPGWLPWVAGLVVLALVGIVGGTLAARSGDTTGEPRETGSADASESALPDAEGTEGPVERPDRDQVLDLSREATAEVPAVAPRSRDNRGQPVTFVGANMLDGHLRTAWRMPGDGTGETITFDLGGEVVLTEVGIINGYAKIDGADNWYRGNRRLRSVQWEFDDGTRITQDLSDRRAVQPLGVGPVRTATVRLHLLEVTPPGQGRSGRDFTAISEVRFRGAPSVS